MYIGRDGAGFQQLYEPPLLGGFPFLGFYVVATQGKIRCSLICSDISLLHVAGNCLCSYLGGLAWGFDF